MTETLDEDDRLKYPSFKPLFAPVEFANKAFEVLRTQVLRISSRCALKPKVLTTPALPPFSQDRE
jgi:hypothetical protein